MYYSNVSNAEGVDFLQCRNKDFCRWFSQHFRNLKKGYYDSEVSIPELNLKEIKLKDVYPNLLTFKKEDLSLVNDLQDFFESKDHSLEWENDSEESNLVIQNSQSGDIEDYWYEESFGSHTYVWLESGYHPRFYNLQVDESKYTVLTF